MAEHLLCKERVRSSSLLVSTTSRRQPRHPGRRVHQRSLIRRRRVAPASNHAIPSSLAPSPRGFGSTDQRNAGNGSSRGPSAAGPRVGGAPSQVNMSIGRSSLLKMNFDFGRVRRLGVPGSASICTRISIPRPSDATARWVSCRSGQATQGTGWMPWRQEPMKDVAGDETLRGAASKL